MIERQLFNSLDINRKKEFIKEKTLRKVQEAYDHSEFYRCLYRSHKVNPHRFKELSDLSYLPIINKRDILDNTNKLLLEYIDRDHLISANTGGSTGNPLKLYRTKEEMAEEYAYLDYYLKYDMNIKFKRKIILRGNSSNDDLFRRFGCNLILSSQLINRDNILSVAEEIKKFNPQLLHAYPSSILKMTELINRFNLHLNIPNILTSSEMITKKQLDILRATYCANVIDLYGNSEHSVLAINTGDAYNFDLTYGYTEFIEGKIISTKLLSSPMPLIRYDCGDTYSKTSILCNDLTNKVLESIGGREIEYVYDKNNNKLPVVSIILGQHYSFFDSVIDYSLVQNMPGELIIEYVSNKAINNFDIDSAIRKMNIITKSSLSLKFKKVEKIRLSNNGKKEFVYRNGDKFE
ncbi:hypothetical protein RKK48_002897 [Vibrio cholerae]|nr:hypothetical protein [Vibrio cholerae]